jgi:alkylresorcinol/alkylpyrone synthase
MFGVVAFRLREKDDNFWGDESWKQAALDLPSGHLHHSRDILRDYGNLSGATVMFVLEAALRSPQAGAYLLSAFGPGFSAGLLLLQVP